MNTTIPSTDASPFSRMRHAMALAFFLLLSLLGSSSALASWSRQYCVVASVHRLLLRLLSGSLLTFLGLLSMAAYAPAHAQVGVTWNTRVSAADYSWTAVTYGNGPLVNGGNGLFVAVGAFGSGDGVMTSPDGVTWTKQTQVADNSWRGVTYGNGLFVAVASTLTGNADANRIMTSPDGINWTARTPPASNTNSWMAVTYGNNLFVAVSNTPWAWNQVMTSPDGITWTGRGPAAGNAWRSVTYGNGLFVAVASSLTMSQT